MPELANRELAAIGLSGAIPAASPSADCAIDRRIGNARSLASSRQRQR